MNGIGFLPIALGLLSAGVWGAGDFSGGLATRRTPIYSVLIPAQTVGFALIVGASFVMGEKFPPIEHLIGGALAGLLGAIGLVALYRALALGKMGVAAPVSAVVAAIVPLIFSLFTDGLPPVLRMVGFALALISVWFVSRTEHGAIKLHELGLPVIAGISFALFFIIMSRVNTVSFLYPLAAARCASLTMFILFTSVRGEQKIPPRAHLPLIALSGVLDALGNILYVAAAHVGTLAIAAVLSSLYPASTIVLARVILHEKIARPQFVGIVAALIAIALISV